ncbi:MAG TPA: HAD family hydrolase, partial [Phototrophicaceae bacterium]|nr:HAD family hydrolase [Phototrophicaceae bacterium]
MALKAVIFDMDDTLVDWSGCVRAHGAAARRTHLSQFHSHIEAAGHTMPDLDVMGETYVTVLREMWDQLDGMNVNEKLPCYTDMLAETLHRSKVDTSRLNLIELQDQIVGVLQDGVAAYPDARSVLETLRNSGLLTGLLTNAP